MCQLIEEALAAATQGGMTPTEIRLGRRQMEEFHRWAARYMSRGAPTQGLSDSYDDIPVVEVNRESHRSVVGADGHALVLE